MKTGGLSSCDIYTKVYNEKARSIWNTESNFCHTETKNI